MTTLHNLVPRNKKAILRSNSMIIIVANYNYDKEGENKRLKIFHYIR